MEEIKAWVEGFIRATERKLANMNKVVPDHRNIKRFEGELRMAKRTLSKITEIENPDLVNKRGLETDRVKLHEFWPIKKRITESEPTLEAIDPELPIFWPVTFYDDTVNDTVNEKLSCNTYDG